MRYRRHIRNGSWAYRSKAASRSVHRSVGTLFLALTCTRFANVEQTGRKKRNSRRSSASIPCFSPLSSIIDRYFPWFSADNQRELKKKKRNTARPGNTCYVSWKRQNELVYRFWFRRMKIDTVWNRRSRYHSFASKII